MSQQLTVEYGEQTLRLTYHYTPGDPGQTSGPPERCWPPEPEEVEIEKIELRAEPPLEMVHNPRYQRHHWIDVTDLIFACAGDVSAKVYLDLEEKVLDFIHDKEEPDHDD